MIKRTLMAALLASTFLFSGTGQASAAPVAAIAAGLFTGGLGTILLQAGASMALSALANKLTKKKQRGNTSQSGGISTDKTMSGGTVPQSMIFGHYATAGHSITAPMTFDHNGSKDLKYMSYVIAISDFPTNGIASFIVDDKEYNIDPRTVPSGHSIFGQSLDGDLWDKAWVRFHNGKQTNSDGFLTNYLHSYPERPWSADHKLMGVAYAVMTFAYDQETFTGLPEVKFVVRGASLYDPRKDSTVGGSGSHRWNNQASWEFSENPVVMAYNIMRGITLADGNVYGLKVPASNLPLSRWMAAMNTCDEPGTETSTSMWYNDTKRYQAGLEIFFDQEPLAVIEELLTAAAGEVAEVGGDYIVTVGPPAVAATATFTDDEVLISENRDFTMINGLAETYNSVTATYPSPQHLWEETEAEPFEKSEWIEDDGGRKLVAELNLPSVTRPRQVRRLMRELATDNRRTRTHTIVLGPWALGLVPLDIISWTSAEHGYTNKKFEITGKVIDTTTLCSTFTIRERDTADYNPNLIEDAKVPAVTNITQVKPTISGVNGFTASAIEIKNNSGVTKKVGIRIEWAQSSPYTALAYEIHNNTTGIMAKTGSVADISLGMHVVSDGILPNHTYKVRVKAFISGRKAEWSSWLTVITSDAYITNDDFNGGIGSFLDSQDIYILPAKTALPEFGDYDGQVVFNKTTGQLFVWVESDDEWVEQIELNIRPYRDEFDEALDLTIAARNAANAHMVAANNARVSAQSAFTQANTARSDTLGFMNQANAFSISAGNFAANAQAFMVASNVNALASNSAKIASQAAQTASELARNQAQVFANNSSNSAYAAAGHASTAQAASNSAGNSASAAAASVLVAQAAASNSAASAAASALSSNSAAAFANASAVSAAVSANNALQANTSRAQAQSAASNAASSATSANASAASALSSSNISARAQREASQAAQQNLIGRSNFEDNILDGWTGTNISIQDVPAAHPWGRTKALRIISRDQFYDVQKPAQWLGARRFRMRGWIYQESTLQVKLGIHCLRIDGTNQWPAQTIAQPISASPEWVFFDVEYDFDFTNVRSWRPFLQINGYAPETFLAHLTDIQMYDITDEYQARLQAAAASVSANSAAAASANAQAAASLATTQAGLSAASALASNTAAAASANSATLAQTYSAQSNAAAQISQNAMIQTNTFMGQALVYSNSAAQSAQVANSNAQIAITQAGLSAASANSANSSSIAAAASASAAAASANSSGQFAAASANSALQANTARSGAISARDEAILARDSANASAVSAATNAGISVSARDAAQNAASNAAVSALASQNSASISVAAANSSGQFAAAANTAKTAAETARSQALTYSQNSANSASNSAASAAAALVSQGLSANSANIANGHAQAALSSMQLANSFSISANSSAAQALEYRDAAAIVSTGGISKNPTFNEWETVWFGEQPKNMTTTIGDGTGMVATKVTGANAKYVHAIQLTRLEGAPPWNGPSIDFNRTTHGLKCSTSPTRVKIRMEIEYVSGNIVNSGAQIYAMWNYGSGSEAWGAVGIRYHMTQTTGIIQNVEIVIDRPSDWVSGGTNDFTIGFSAASNSHGGSRANASYIIHRFDFEEISANALTSIYQNAVADVNNMKGTVALRAIGGNSSAGLELVAMSNPNGSASAARISANNIILDGTVNAKTLALGDFSNMLVNDWTEGNAEGWSIQGGGGRSAVVQDRTDSTFTNAGIAGNALVCDGPDTWIASPPVPVSSGEQLHGEVWIVRSSALPVDAGSTLVQIRWNMVDGSATYTTIGSHGTIGGDPTKVSRIVTAPDNVKTAALWFRTSIGATTGRVVFTKPRLRRAYTGQLIVDGSITTQHMVANSVTTAILAAGAVKAENIDANAINVKHLAVTNFEELADTRFEALERDGFGSMATGTWRKSGNGTQSGVMHEIYESTWSGYRTNKVLQLRPSGSYSEGRTLAINIVRGLKSTSKYKLTGVIAFGTIAAGDNTRARAGVYTYTGTEYKRSLWAMPYMSPADQGEGISFELEITLNNDEDSIHIVLEATSTDGLPFKTNVRFNGISLRAMNDASLIVNGAITTDHLNVGFLDGEYVQADFLKVKTKLDLDSGGSFAYNKKDMNDDNKNGIFFGRTTNGFGFAATRKNTSTNIVQSIKITDSAGLEIRNPSFTLQQPVTIDEIERTTNLSRTALPAGTTKVYYKALGAGGGGARWASTSAPNAGTAGGNTIIRFYNGTTLLNTVTANGGAGGSGYQLSRSASFNDGQDSTWGQGGRRRNAPEGRNGDTGAGGVGASDYYATVSGNAVKVWSQGGRAGSLVSGTYTFPAGTTDPRIEIVIGAGGVWSGGNTGSQASRAGNGGAGMVKYTVETSAIESFNADVVPLRPINKGTIAKSGTTATFPALGGGYWLLYTSDGSNLDIGELNAGGTNRVGADKTNCIGFFSDRTPARTSGGTSRTITINYVHYPMGSWS